MVEKEGTDGFVELTINLVNLEAAKNLNGVQDRPRNIMLQMTTKVFVRQVKAACLFERAHSIII